MKKKFEKIFIIGYNKTATSTLDALFSYNGWSSEHKCKDWAIDEKEVFSDQHPQFTNFFDFKKLSNKYPNSLFILNLRKLDDWIMSRCGHVVFNQAVQSIKNNIRPTGQVWAYPSIEDIAFDTKCFFEINEELKVRYTKFVKEKIKFWIEERENYYTDILKFFRDKKDKLLIIDVNKNWKAFVADHTMENYESLPSDRMAASNRDSLVFVKEMSVSKKKKLDNYMSTHKSLAKKAMDEVLSEYPSCVKDSVLLHDDRENKKFLNIYKNNFKEQN